ncbi:hypothetical protein HND25_02240 [Rhodococcus erythropolis]|uniref:hypothetical protein n=1 Tax=Rhodococcus erythropolis TaxID=1833 RepID=UPI000A780017|nr:hypothetical protein [Rhodococcus erythropolis]MBO8145079.1 hypothetical protein [Rhodococcus erythropolis]MDO1487436.1 hypothetical protein [Rhodococcus erythropolis]GCB58716.1 hypothetical protein rerp_51240 [Rhodococcus erythropolis]
MRTFLSDRRGQVMVAVAAAILVVAGGLWWTKTISFTETAVVQFSSNRTGLYDGSPRDAYISEREASNGMSVPAEKLAQILGGSASDYESDLTITDADVPGLAVTARGRTPSAARALATDAAEALCSMFEEANAMTSGGFTFTVVPPGN